MGAQRNSRSTQHKSAGSRIAQSMQPLQALRPADRGTSAAGLSTATDTAARRDPRAALQHSKGAGDSHLDMQVLDPVNMEGRRRILAILPIPELGLAEEHLSASLLDG